jgi:chromate transporter
MDFFTLGQVALVFGKLSILSFGGGTAVLAEMERETIGRGWVTHQQFLESYALGQLTPGPGMTMVVPVGYQAAGVPGGIVAFVAFFAPTVLLALAAILMCSRIRESRWPKAIRIAMLPVANGLMLASAYTVGTATGINLVVLGIAALATGVLLATKVPAPAVVLGAGVLGAAFIRA